MPAFQTQRFPWYLALVFLCAVWLEGFHAQGSFDLSFDNYQQIAAAQNWVDGRGLVVRYYDDTSQSAVRARPLTQWPPGFSWLVAAPLALGWDPVTSVRVLHWLSALGFLVGWFGWILALRPSLGDGPALVGAAFGAIGITPIQYLPTGDRLALALFFPATWVLYRLATRTARKPWLETGAAAALLTGTMLLRYLYWPLVVLAPVVAFSPRRKKGRVLALSFGLAGAVLLALLGGIYQQGPDGILHWETLRYFKPFPAHAFGFHRGLRGLFHFLGKSSDLQFTALWILSAAVTAGWAFGTYQGLRREDETRVFHGLSLLCVAGTALLVVTISLGLDPAWRKGDLVTPVREVRYFAPCSPFLVLGFLFLLKRLDWARVAAGGLFALALAMGAVGRYRLTAPVAWGGAGRADQEVAAFRSIRGQVREFRRRGYEVFWTNNGNPYRHYQAVASGVIPFDPARPRHPALESGRAVVYNSKRHTLSIPQKSNKEGTP